MRTMLFTAFIPGIPKAQPRARLSTRGGKPHAYNPNTADAWKQMIALYLKRYMPKKPYKDIPIRVDLQFYLPVCKSLQKEFKEADQRVRHILKPDIDNLNKAVFDTLKYLGLYDDDCQIAEGETIKWMAVGTRESHGGCEITVYLLNRQQGLLEE